MATDGRWLWTLVRGGLEKGGGRVADWLTLRTKKKNTINRGGGKRFQNVTRWRVSEKSGQPGAGIKKIGPRRGERGSMIEEINLVRKKGLSQESVCGPADQQPISAKE